jgi:hypothetical protein
VITCIGFSSGQTQVHDAEFKTIAILDFDLVDDQSELAPVTVEYRRLQGARDQLQAEFASNQRYRVVDPAPVAHLIAKYRAQSALHACNGCELEIARALRVDRVLTGWGSGQSCIGLQGGFNTGNVTYMDSLGHLSLVTRRD